MQYSELKILMQAVDIKAENEKKELIKKYCEIRNPVKVGDIVTDHIGKGHVKKISYSFNSGDPCCVYECVELTKNLKVMKRKTMRLVYQSNLISIENQRY